MELWIYLPYLFVFLIFITGAFLIPYLIVLVIIGRPLYYLEMLLGQFSGRSSLKVFDLAPAMRGKVFYTTMRQTFCNERTHNKKKIHCFDWNCRRRLWASYFNGNRWNLLRQHNGCYLALFLQFIQIDATMDHTFK